MIGKNILEYFPQGNAQKLWMKIQNEIQMRWFDHPVNQAREAAGKLPINGLWLYGGGRLSPHAQQAPFDWIMADAPLAAGLSQHQRVALKPLSKDLATAPLQEKPEGKYKEKQEGKQEEKQHTKGLIILDQLMPFYLEQDGQDEQGLNKAWETLEKHWFKPLLDALYQGKVDRLFWVLCDEDKTVTLKLCAKDRWKFWKQLSWPFSASYSASASASLGAASGASSSASPGAFFSTSTQIKKKETAL